MNNGQCSLQLMYYLPANLPHHVLSHSSGKPFEIATKKMINTSSFSDKCRSSRLKDTSIYRLFIDGWLQSRWLQSWLQEGWLQFGYSILRSFPPEPQSCPTYSVWCIAGLSLSSSNLYSYHMNDHIMPTNSDDKPNFHDCFHQFHLQPE